MEPNEPPLGRFKSEFFDLENTSGNGHLASDYKDIYVMSSVSDMLIDMGWLYFVEESGKNILFSLIDRKIIKCKDDFKGPLL